MATSKVISTTTLSIEVQSSVDKAGDPIYTKKSFSNIKNGADPQNVFDVAQAIKGVLSANTGDVYLNESSALEQA
ncbi:DUF1659 domain-containing protein [Clostridium chromiireducens]|uniref:DUF1659 domain-containing protein n=1 Tax=Clostridium chromiireducens TaxID=225345 RepID=A0A1V4IF90_9CLOT|nr:DUF1659 domain-containing protein [Clostridium chromiireducens]OPJ58520.1 hypothetical protein CLCHR_38800 [Clostridium chromiireducens]RII32993.1 DUF1659 domain-containing protein [Clostridium chromiireducens]